MAVADNLKRIRESLDKEAAACGRPESSVRLVAVSKTRTREEVIEAIAAGQKCFGENRVQEALDKFSPLMSRAELHLIGHLQSNKVRMTAGRFSLIHSVDSLKLAELLSRNCQEAGVTQPVLLQVNTSGEKTKSGFLSFDELSEAAEIISGLPFIIIKGLMTMAPPVDEPEPVARTFSLCRDWRNKLEMLYPGKVGSELSMGMSSDYKIAVREGATLVRIGTALFGERSYPA